MISYYNFTYPEDYYPQGFGTVVSPQEWWNKYRYFVERGEPAWKDVIIPTFQLEGGRFADYMDNDCGFNLCSERLMNIVEHFKSENDVLEWYKVDVLSTEKDISLPYFILHLPIIHSVLDEEKTLYHKVFDDEGTFFCNVVIKPRFKWEAIKDYNVFGYAGSDTVWYVSEAIKEAIEKEGCTGLVFNRIQPT
jgi:hypothetical protein